MVLLVWISKRRAFRRGPSWCKCPESEGTWCLQNKSYQCGWAEWAERTAISNEIRKASYRSRSCWVFCPSLPLLWELFSAPFPLQALRSPSELSVILHIILAGIKYNCVWKVQKSKLPLGIFFSVSPVELKTSVSLKRYVFQAAGVLICKAHYSNKTLKQSSISQSSGPVSTPAPASPAIVFLSSFRAQSQDLSIDIWT